MTVRAEEWRALPKCPTCNVPAGEQCRRVRLDGTTSSLLRPEPHADRLPPDPQREKRLRIAAQVIGQMGDVAALQAELEHPRAAEHPDWAAAVRREINRRLS